jgi:hypothetical protein
MGLFSEGIEGKHIPPSFTLTHPASGWRIHCGVEVTELSTNKQHTLSQNHQCSDSLSNDHLILNLTKEPQCHFQLKLCIWVVTQDKKSLRGRCFPASTQVR